MRHKPFKKEKNILMQFQNNHSRFVFILRICDLIVKLKKLVYPPRWTWVWVNQPDNLWLSWEQKKWILVPKDSTCILWVYDIISPCSWQLLYVKSFRSVSQISAILLPLMSALIPFLLWPWYFEVERKRGWKNNDHD